MRIGTLTNLQPRELSQMMGSTPIAKPEGATKAASTLGTEGTKSFSNVLDSAVGEVDSKLQAASAETTKLLTGETTNVHQAVIAMQEASVAFSLMVEVRNKLVDSYQELMRMQV